MFRTIMGAATAALILIGATPGFAAQNAPKSVGSPEIPPPPLYSPYAQAIADIGQAGAVVSFKGFSNLTHPGTGLYCFTLAASVQQATVPAVTIDFFHSTGVVLFAQWDSSNEDCGGTPGGNKIEVRTYKGDTSGSGSAYQVPVLSDQVGFVILVP